MSKRELALTIRCPRCGAAAGEPCRSRSMPSGNTAAYLNTPMKTIHSARYRASQGKPEPLSAEQKFEQAYMARKAVQS